MFEADATLFRQS